MNNIVDRDRSFLTWTNVCWSILYLGMVLGIVWGMLLARRQALETYGTSQAQTDWEQWVEAAREQSTGQGPVLRRAPRSPAPPALLLMTRHFATCLLGAVLLSSALFLSLMVMVRGALRSAVQESPEAERPQESQSDGPEEA